MSKFAKIISFIFSPVFILLPIPFLLVEESSENYIYAFKWTIFSYAFIFVVAAFVLLGVFLGFFSNFDVSKREQRPALFIFSAFVLFCYALSLIIFNAPNILFVPLLGIGLGLIVIIIVNKWIKASIHLATFTSVVLFIGMLFKGYSFLLLLLIPLLAWSRIKMKEHTFWETVVGALIGVILTIVVYTISKQYLLGIIYK